MDNILAKIPITKKDRETVSRYELLNMSRVTDFFTNNSGGVTFFYQDISTQRDKTTEYETSLNLLQFENYFYETQVHNFIVINVSKWNKKPIGNSSPGDLEDFPYSHDKINLNLDFYVKAVAKPSRLGTGSYVFIARGGFNYLVIETGDTLDEINTTSSVSGSIPA